MIMTDVANKKWLIVPQPATTVINTIDGEFVCNCISTEIAKYIVEAHHKTLEQTTSVKDPFLNKALN